ncbi:MAG: hypothetical protein WAM46_05780 [Flavobacterium sp.]
MKFLKIAVIIIFFTSCRNNEIKSGDKKAIEVVDDFSDIGHIESPYCLKVDFETGNEYYQTNIDTFLLKHNLKRNTSEINNLFSSNTVDFISDEKDYFMHHPYSGKASSVGKIIINGKINAVLYAYLVNSEITQPRIEIQTFNGDKLVDKLIVASIFTGECNGFRDFCISKDFEIKVKDYYGCGDDESSKYENVYDFKISKNGFFERLDNKKQTSSLNNSKIDIKYHGTFSATVETESTTSGMASITYNFSISDDYVILQKVSYHEPIDCSGKYRAFEKNNILELFYNENDKSCKTDKSNFKIKKEENEFYIKGLGGEGTFNEWIKLEKK